MFVATVSKLQLQVLLEKLSKETNEFKKQKKQILCKSLGFRCFLQTYFNKRNRQDVTVVRKLSAVNNGQEDRLKLITTPQFFSVPY